MNASFLLDSLITQLLRLTIIYLSQQTLSSENSMNEWLFSFLFSVAACAALFVDLSHTARMHAGIQLVWIHLTDLERERIRVHYIWTALTVNL